MRRALALACLLASACPPTAGEEVGAWPPSTTTPAPPLEPVTGWWRARYALTVDGGLPGEEPLAISLRPDGGVLVAGSLEGVVVDEAGVAEARWAFRAPTSAFRLGGFLRTARHHQGRVLAGLGESSAENRTLHAVTIAEFGDDGAVLRNRRYTAPASVGAPLVFRAADGADVVLMRDQVARFDASGAVAWAWTFAVGARELRAWQALELPGGDWLVAFGGPVVDAPVLLARLDGATGAVRWSKELEVRQGQHSFSDFALDADGQVVFCAGVMQSQGPPGALVRLDPNGDSATARQVHLWRASTLQCGRFLMGRAVGLVRRTGGWACHLEATVGSSDGTTYRPLRVEFPEGSAPSAELLLGHSGAALSDGSLLVLGGNSTGFELTHPAKAPACAERLDLRDLGVAPATLQAVTMTAAPLVLTPATTLVFDPLPLEVAAHSLTCR